MPRLACSARLQIFYTILSKEANTKVPKNGKIWFKLFCVFRNSSVKSPSNTNAIWIVQCVWGLRQKKGRLMADQVGGLRALFLTILLSWDTLLYSIQSSSFMVNMISSSSPFVVAGDRPHGSLIIKWMTFVIVFQEFRSWSTYCICSLFRHKWSGEWRRTWSLWRYQLW